MKHLALGIAMTLAVAAGGTGHLTAQGRNGGYEGSFSRTLTISGPLDLDVATGSGSIEIRQGSSNRVENHGKIHVGTDRFFRSDRDAEDTARRIEANPPIEQTGTNHVRIGRVDNRDDGRNVSISYEIEVPAEVLSVKAHTGSGSQTITGLSGPIDASTGSGSITLTNLRGKINTHTGSGSIHGSGITGAFEGTTGSGGITVQGEQTGPWNLETGSGSVNVRLPQNAAFDLNAHTGSGGVHVDFPITMQGRLDNRRQDVRGKIGGGGHALDVRTGSGSIRIE